MKQDAFSRMHPAVNLIFFVGALGFGVVIQHPFFLLVGIVCAFAYYLLLHGKQGIKRIAMMLPVFLAVIFLNPLINRNGQNALCVIFGMSYTLEALIYGAVLSGMFLTMILWFACYSKVITGDKFTALFGNLAPSLSLLLVMIFRMVPNLIRKGKQIAGARQSIGKNMSDKAETMTVLGCLTTWTLEGGIVTADSMRSRGYATAKRTSFAIYRMTLRDWIILAVMLMLAGVVIGMMAAGEATATFTPQWYIAPTNVTALVIYCTYLLIPTLLHIEEGLVWHISRSKI